MNTYTYKTYIGTVVTVTEDEVKKFGGEDKFFSRNFIVEFWRNK